MTAYRITKFELQNFHSVPHVKVHLVEDATSIPAAVCTVPAADLIEALVELQGIYDIHPYNIFDLLPREIQSAVRPIHIMFPTCKISLGGNGTPDQYTVSAKNGDTGELDYGFGRSVGMAIFDLAKSHGFKTQISDGHTTSLAQWFQDFDYGFDRASDDQLRLEMEGIVAPDKGSW